MIDSSDLISDFEQLLTVCPPYASPGTTAWSAIMSGAGCDCSGVFSAAFARHGGSIYHGANTIARKYVTALEKLTNTGQLSPGMAVFKWSTSGEPSKYSTDGLGNFHHIGLVTSTNPLRIIHQSSAAGCTACDTKIKNWQYCASLKNVSYENATQTVAKEGSKAMYTVKVNTQSLRIRASASTGASVLGSLRKGTVVDCSEMKNGWLRLADQDGWISSKYVIITAETDDDEEEKTDDTETGDSSLEERVAILEDEVATLKGELELLKGDDALG